MIFIIVGPDGAGKSTLAKRVAEDNNCEIIKRDKPKDLSEKLEMFNDYMKGAKHLDNVVYDRYIYCEQVYGPIMRDETIISASAVRLLEQELKKKNAVIIHCTDDTDKLWKRCQARGEDYVTDMQTLDAVRKGYDDVLAQSTLPVIRYCIHEEV